MTTTDQNTSAEGIEQALRAAVEAARHAPSLHNAQPWRWRVTGRLAELYADPTRALPVADPMDRELRISCGAALEHARIALAAAGWHVMTTRLPDPSRPELIGCLNVAGRLDPNLETMRLAAAIPFRRSDRRPYALRDVPVAAHEALIDAALHHEAGLVVVHDADQRTELAVLADRAAHVQENEPGYAEELARWTGTRADAAGVIPQAVPHLEQPRHSDVPLRDWTLRHEGALPTAQGVDEQPLWCLLATDADSPADQVRAGQALARVLLTATSLGLASNVQSQPIEIPGVRLQLEHWLLANLGTPQALIRLGWPDPAASPLPNTPRRPITDILSTD